jgi:hypothetical protein
MFKERLGLVIEKEDEISCAVGGCNFLLRAISHEAFTFTNGQSNFLTFPSARAGRFRGCRGAGGGSVVAVTRQAEVGKCRARARCAAHGTAGWGCGLCTAGRLAPTRARAMSAANRIATAGRAMKGMQSEATRGGPPRESTSRAARARQSHASPLAESVMQSQPCHQATRLRAWWHCA